MKSPWLLVATCLFALLACESQPPIREEPPASAPPSGTAADSPVGPTGTGPIAGGGGRPRPPPPQQKAPPRMDPWLVRPGQWMANIRADDPPRVDVVDLIPQVEALVEKLEPRAKLVHIHAGEVVAGTIDVRKPAAAAYEYEYEGLDKTQPPGKDEVKVAITVSAGESQLWAYTHGGAHVLRMDLEGRPLENPCPSKQAWKAAVKSGVPEDAVASFDYGPSLDTEVPGTGGGRVRRREWTLRVKGHDELKRALTPETCEVFQKPQAAPTAGQSGEPATPGAPARPRAPGAAGGVVDPWSKPKK